MQLISAKTHFLSAHFLKMSDNNFANLSEIATEKWTTLWWEQKQQDDHPLRTTSQPEWILEDD